MMERLGKVKKGDGKDVHHKDGNPMNANKSNLKVVRRSKNRSFPRNSKSGKKMTSQDAAGCVLLG